MYARLVKSHLKPGKYEMATRMLEEKVIPMLKKQKGFRDEVSFLDEDHKESVAISFWDTEKDVRKYEADVYPKVIDTMKDTIEGKPVVQHFEVANSTWYNIHAR